jgi:hypothetical protein
MGYHAMFMAAMLCYIVRVYGYTLLTPATVQYGRLCCLATPGLVHPHEIGDA